MTNISHPGSPNAPAPRLPLLPQGFGWIVFALLSAGLLLLYVPAYLDLAKTVWATDEQGHGPIILAVSIWLLYGKRHELAAAPIQPLPWLGWAGRCWYLAWRCMRWADRKTSSCSRSARRSCC